MKDGHVTLIPLAIDPLVDCIIILLTDFAPLAHSSSMQSNKPKLKQFSFEFMSAML